MGYRETYESWLNNPYFDEATRAELQAIAGNEKEMEERFYMDLEFGTAGLRGVIGAGTNRMNIYTVRKATQGLANYICKVGMIPDICPRSSPTRRRFVLQRTALRHMYLNR